MKKNNIEGDFIETGVWKGGNIFQKIDYTGIKLFKI